MDTDAVLALMVEVAEEVIDPRFRALDEGQVDEKRPGDLVTVADREAEVLLTRALNAAYPGAVVLGEEAYAGDRALADRFRAAEHAFTVDPVDGTKNFVQGKRDHAVMVGEVRGGEAVRGWIWQPQHRLAYVAERGAGAWRNGERLTRPPVGADPRVVTSRRTWIGRRFDGLRPLELTWVCCGVDYPKLVEGEADAIIYGRAHPWDHAPGSLLVTESGGYVGTLEGRTYRPGDPLGPQDRPAGLLVAADRATYDRVVAAV